MAFYADKWENGFDSGRKVNFLSKVGQCEKAFSNYIRELNIFRNLIGPNLNQVALLSSSNGLVNSILLEVIQILTVSARIVNRPFS